MARIHYLNVGNGDCSIIEHNTKRVTIIDVNLAKPTDPATKFLNSLALELRNTNLSGINTKGNYNQKSHPDNPIEYIETHNIDKVFRFILTHPDSDHLGGIGPLFEAVKPLNFWDLPIEREPLDTEDWQYYEKLKKSGQSPKRLSLYAGSTGQYWNVNENGVPGGDGITILSPTLEMVEEANKTGEVNDTGYVILYRTWGYKILFSGDSNDITWQYILNTNNNLIKDCDVLIAPHHGRKSDRDYEYLDIVNPKLTLFGNAKWEFLAYPAYKERGLEVITNNQANSIILDVKEGDLSVYATYKKFASDYCLKHYNKDTFYDPVIKGYYLKTL